MVIVVVVVVVVLRVLVRKDLTAVVELGVEW